MISSKKKTQHKLGLLSAARAAKSETLIRRTSG